MIVFTPFQPRMAPLLGSAEVQKALDTLYQQMLSEMQQPDFVATWGLLTAWGNAPLSKRRPGGDYPS
jgi:hypothetical protein